jgi:hypothetical protein
MILASVDSDTLYMANINPVTSLSYIIMHLYNNLLIYKIQKNEQSHR